MITKADSEKVAPTTDQMFVIGKSWRSVRNITSNCSNLLLTSKQHIWRVTAECVIQSDKLIALTKMTLEGANSRVEIRNKLSEPLDIEEGDPLATHLFNLILEAAVKTTSMDTSSANSPNTVKCLVS